MNTGEQSGTWGTKTNTNLELIGEALGFGTEAITDNANTHATTVADATSDAGRAIYISYTGALDSDCTITIGPDTMKRVHIIKNATTDSGSSGPYNILIKQGSGAGAAVTIPNGDTKIVSLDGGGSGAIVTDVLDSLSVIDLKVQDDLTVSDDLLLSSDSAIIKFGADADTTLTHTDGTGLTLNGTNKLTFGDVASFIQQSADGTLTIDGEAIIDLNASTRVDVSGDLKVGDDLTLGSDDAVLGFGADTDTTLTHTDGSGLTLNSTNKLMFRDSALSVSSSSDGKLDIDADTECEITAPTIDLTASTKVTVSNDVEVTGRSVGVTVTAENDGSFDLAVGNDFTCTTTGNTEITFSNAAAGQSGNIKFVNGSNHTITANALVAINADVLTTISASGTYHLAYFVTAASGNDTILVSASAILT